MSISLSTPNKRLTIQDLCDPDRSNLANDGSDVIILMTIVAQEFLNRFVSYPNMIPLVLKHKF